MQENKRATLHAAMYYGSILGLFWVFRYLFLMAQPIGDLFLYLFFLMNAGTFLVIYILYFKFRDANPDQIKTTWQCIWFTTLLCFFASFFEAAIIYAHYKFIDPSYFLNMTAPLMQALENIKGMDSIPAEDLNRAKELYTSILSSKAVYIIGAFIKNTLLGFLLGVVMSLIVRNKTK